MTREQLPNRLVSAESPVVGVVNCHNLASFIYDEINDGIDIAYEEWALERKEELETSGMAVDIIEETIEHESQDMEFEDSNILVGDWKRNDDGKFEIDKNGKAGWAGVYRSCSGAILCVEYSKHTVRTHHTSPCYVMSDGRPCGDLDTKGDSVLAFTLPPEYFEKD